MSKSFADVEKNLSLSSVTVHTNISNLEVYGLMQSAILFPQSCCFAPTNPLRDCARQDLMVRAKDVSLFVKNCVGPVKSFDGRSGLTGRQPLRERSSNSLNIERSPEVPTKIVVTSEISPPIA